MRGYISKVGNYSLILKSFTCRSQKYILIILGHINRICQITSTLMEAYLYYYF